MIKSLNTDAKKNNKGELHYNKTVKEKSLYIICRRRKTVEIKRELGSLLGTICLVNVDSHITVTSRFSYESFPLYNNHDRSIMSF